MRLEQDQPIILVGGKAFHLLAGRSEGKNYSHHFGGDTIQVKQPGTSAAFLLQSLFSLELSDPKLRPLGRSNHLKFYYGFQHVGFEIEYQIDGDGVQVRDLAAAKPEPDFPYTDYPANFPSKPAYLEPIEFKDVKELVDSYAYLAHLFYVEETFDLDRYVYVVVTPRQEYGVSLWGKDGDEAMVTIGFSVETKSGTIKAVQAMG
ncbi:MAG: hypothetical protein ACO1QS_14400 [Verrucomicrobiota bacterium]